MSKKEVPDFYLETVGADSKRLIKASDRKLLAFIVDIVIDWLNPINRLAMLGVMDAFNSGPNFSAAEGEKIILRNDWFLWRRRMFINPRTAAEHVALRAACTYCTQYIGRLKDVSEMDSFIARLRKSGMRDILIAEVFAIYLLALADYWEEEYLSTGNLSCRKETARLRAKFQEIQSDLDKGILPPAITLYGKS